jgi:uncharacterized protein (DUF1697 family)
MTAWVALLRGVNVGGITVRSADLAELFRGLGFEAVRTVLASGNVVFEAAAGPARRDELKRSIEAALRDRFAYEAWILLVTRSEVEAAIEAFPFDATDQTRQPWVIFCLDEATAQELTTAAASLDPKTDPIAAEEQVIYWNPAKGSTTDTPFAKILAKAAFKPRTTNRNLRTLAKIVG